MTVAGADEIFVERSVADPRDESFPDARSVMSDAKRVGVPVPAVEVADHRYLGRVRRPDREQRPGLSSGLHGVRSKFLVEAEVVPLFEEIDVMLRQETHS